VDNFQNLYLNNQLCFALYSATHAVTRSYDEHLSEVGMTYPQYLVMLVLWQHQNQNVNALAHKLGLDSRALTPILKRLELAGLITREPSNQNKRMMVISLTKRGSEIQAQTSRIQQHVSCETGLTQLEYIELKDKLTHMLNNFKLQIQRPDAWVSKLPSDL
jgi:MarR family transcriptional regulator, organic hydroperoxide resistance regulator